MRRLACGFERSIGSMLTGALALGVLAGGCPSMDEAGAAALDGSAGAPSSGSDGALESPGAQGAAGAPGTAGAAGLNCWDINGNGIADPLEDFNADGVFDALDCQGIFAVGTGLQLSGDLVGLDTSFTDSRYWKLGGNNLAGPFSLGTLDAQPLELLVSGMRVLRIEPTSATPNLIGGASTNRVHPGVDGAVIAGGGEFPAPNEVFDSFGTIGGGLQNVAGTDDADPALSPFATVGGGYVNAARGAFSVAGGGAINEADGTSATIAGGQTNIAAADFSAIGGGVSNNASGYASTVAGGLQNSTSGYAAAVLGGAVNTASGQFATVLGGYGATAPQYGQVANAAGSFAAPGDAQTCTYVMRGKTVGAVAGELYLNGTDLRLAVPLNATIVYDIWVAGRSDLGAAGGFKIQAMAENQNGATVVVGVTGVTIDGLAGGVALTADDATDSIVLTATGAAGVNIRWVATVRTTEVVFP